MSLWKRTKRRTSRRRWIARGVVGGVITVAAFAAWWSHKADTDPDSLPAVVNTDVWPWARWLLLIAVLAAVAAAARRWLSSRVTGRNGTAGGDTDGARLAGWWETLRGTGWWALRVQTRVLRPRLTQGMPWWKLWRVPIGQLGLPLGRVRFRWWQPSLQAYVRVHEHTLYLAPTQGGKTAAMSGLAIDHPGPALVTSTNPNIVAQTAALRRRLGPVVTFNPLGVGGVPSDFRWSPTVGCEDPGTAIERAGYLLSGSPSLGGVDSREFWESQAVSALGRLMHAAGLGGRTMLDVLAWATDLDGSARTVLRLLSKSSAGRTWADRHRDFVNLNHNTRSSVTTTIMPALDWLQDPAVAQTVMPGPGEQFDVEEWLKASGTVYLLAELKQHGSIAPLFTAFTSYVYATAKLVAAGSPGHRLDPPLRFVLDEVANVCPVPLPTWASDSAGRGIGLDIGLQSFAQLPWKWGEDGASVIWDNITAKNLFGGFDNPNHLDHFSAVAGRSTERSGGVPMGTTPVVPVDTLRRLSKWTVLSLRRGMRPVYMRVRPAHRRRDVRIAQQRQPDSAPEPAATTVAAVAPEGDHNA